MLFFSTCSYVLCSCVKGLKDAVKGQNSIAQKRQHSKNLSIKSFYDNRQSTLTFESSIFIFTCKDKCLQLLLFVTL